MKNLRTHAQAIIVVITVALSSCHNYETALKKNFDFPAPDSSKFDVLDKPSGKMFDLLSTVSTGIDFVNKVQFGFMADNNLYVNYYNGGGVAVLNYNNDSLPDLYFTGNIVPDELYVNKGNMQFEKVSDKAKEYGIDCPDCFSMGAVFFDYDNDGDMDLYVKNHPSDYVERMRFNN